MTDMFFPSMLLFAIVCIPLAFLPQYDLCTERCRAFFRHLLHRKHS
ncbi:hypothetical protein [Granulicella tundricola]|uniref:Uncharacterized protein n=1 Tax=Granulicella tundricola (strain ATCC BAA-1859 / DSM 23138 / MP5ACTX9) TaxID=1198114 RepID=E8X071_GRATM|nr:hypothetical protein [Granulicella tundricola]ADW70052.1 hypothetical protein AciX9_3032 [Granulicella tundricola MP5ACTX9]